MHALRIERVKGLSGWGIALIAVLLLASALGATAVLRGHASLGLASQAPAPAYVSNVSSMLGTADGGLVEGGSADPSVAPASGPGQQATGWFLIGLSVLGLSAVALSVSALITRFGRRLL